MESEWRAEGKLVLMNSCLRPYFNFQHQAAYCYDLVIPKHTFLILIMLNDVMDCNLFTCLYESLQWVFVALHSHDWHMQCMYYDVEARQISLIRRFWRFSVLILNF